MTCDVQPAWLWPRAAYVHVPFCAHHCCYCDFAIVTGQDQLIDRYLDALEAELSTVGEPQPVQTLFLGGGTPTHLKVAQLDRLLTALGHWLPLEPGHEFSVEANPISLDADKVAVLAGHGVTRFSLGAQSFRAPHLRFLERDHTAADVAQAASLVKQQKAHLSVDLIFGIPGQRVEQWSEDLEQALALGPDHLSTYGLTYEKGTPLWKRLQRGEVQPLDEEHELALYSLAIEVLEHAGFEHYEISSFARPGCRCRHNQVYWANEAYFGFGMGAARYVNGRRELNRRDLHGYLQRALAGEATTMQSETLPPHERAQETLALQLRRAEGIHRRAFRAQTGFELDWLLGAALPRHVELGLLADDGERVFLTRQGKFVADSLVRNLL